MKDGTDDVYAMEVDKKERKSREDRIVEHIHDRGIDDDDDDDDDEEEDAAVVVEASVDDDGDDLPLLVLPSSSTTGLLFMLLSFIFINYFNAPIPQRNVPYFQACIHY